MSSSNEVSSWLISSQQQGYKYKEKASFWGTSCQWICHHCISICAFCCMRQPDVCDLNPKKGLNGFIQCKNRRLQSKWGFFVICFSFPYFSIRILRPLKKTELDVLCFMIDERSNTPKISSGTKNGQFFRS